MDIIRRMALRSAVWLLGVARWYAAWVDGLYSERSRCADWCGVCLAGCGRDLDGRAPGGVRSAVGRAGAGGGRGELW